MRIFTLDANKCLRRCVEIRLASEETVGVIVFQDKIVGDAAVLNAPNGFQNDVVSISSTTARFLNESVAVIDNGEEILNDIGVSVNASLGTGVSDRAKLALKTKAKKRKCTDVNSSVAINLNENLPTSAMELSTYSGKLYPPPKDFDFTDKSLALRVWLAVECKKQVDANGSKFSDSEICRIFSVTRRMFYRHFNDKGGPAAYGYCTVGQKSKFTRMRYTK